MRRAKEGIETLLRLKIENLEHLGKKGFLETLLWFDGVYYITMGETERNLV